jgi:hypothetical protein
MFGPSAGVGTRGGVPCPQTLRLPTLNGFRSLYRRDTQQSGSTCSLGWGCRFATWTSCSTLGQQHLSSCQGRTRSRRRGWPGCTCSCSPRGWRWLEGHNHQRCTVQYHSQDSPPQPALALKGWPVARSMASRTKFSSKLLAAACELSPPTMHAHWQRRPAWWWWWLWWWWLWWWWWC